VPPTAARSGEGDPAHGASIGRSAPRYRSRSGSAMHDSAGGSSLPPAPGVARRIEATSGSEPILARGDADEGAGLGPCPRRHGRDVHAVGLTPGMPRPRSDDRRAMDASALRLRTGLPAERAGPPLPPACRPDGRHGRRVPPGTGPTAPELCDTKYLTKIRPRRILSP
jgi:hypothetical protein